MVCFFCGFTHSMKFANYCASTKKLPLPNTQVILSTEVLPSHLILRCTYLSSTFTKRHAHWEARQPQDITKKNLILILRRKALRPTCPTLFYLQESRSSSVLREYSKSVHCGKPSKISVRKIFLLCRDHYK